MFYYTFTVVLQATMRYLKFLTAALLFFCSCGKDEPTNLAVSLKVTALTFVDATMLRWEPAGSYTDSLLHYSVYMGDSLVAEGLESCSYTLTGLKESTEYTGSIVAYLENEKIGEGLFVFTTLANLPPADFSLSGITIQNKCAFLNWNNATDPEQDTVVYDVYLGNTLKFENLVANECVLSGLMPLTTYNCRIIAKDNKGNTNELPVTFRTIEPDNSREVHNYLTFGFHNRDYAFYLPESIPVARKRPLLIYLHGANGNAWINMQSSYWRTLADREDFIVLIPQALSGTYNNETLFQWNAHYLFPWDDVAFISYLIDYLDDHYGIERSRIYLSGMSNGGFMTFFAAQPMQEKLAAIAPIAGLISSNVFYSYSLSKPMPLCYIHGTADNIVRMDGNPSLNEILSLWIEFNGCNPAAMQEELADINKSDNSTVTLFRYTGTDKRSEIRFYRVNGGGHSIPGIEAGANMDINAYEEIWSFFKRFTL